jgi:hypothetical protein
MGARGLAGLAAAVVVAGCAQWGARPVYGPGRESIRRVLGPPAWAETPRGRRCMQQVEIGYKQIYAVKPMVAGRNADVLGGGGLVLAGFALIVTSDDGGPGLITIGPFQPSSVPRFGVGTAMLATGVSWLWYSFARLPSGPRPDAGPHQRVYSQTTVEPARGCPGMAAAEAAAPPTTADQHARVVRDAELRRLEQLRLEGMITEAEYRRLRADAARAPVEVDDGVPAERGPFDARVAAGAIAELIAEAKACRLPDEPKLATRVRVTYAPDGRAAKVAVLDPPFAGTSTGRCVESVLRRAWILPFAGATTSLVQNITLD